MTAMFILNVNAGQDTIHDPDNLSEQCNTDQIEDRKQVDVKTAAAMIASGQAVICEHCKHEGAAS